MLGSHVTTIAYPLLVLRVTGSPFTAGCAVFAATAPSMFAYVPVGALVDRCSPRWSPRRVMLVSELGRGAAIGTVAATLAFGKPVVALLMIVAVIEGVLEVFSGLAERRCVGSILGPDQVSPALVRIEARTHIVLVAGRPLGGLLFGFGPIFPFLADVASFIYSAAALFRITDISLSKHTMDSFQPGAHRSSSLEAEDQDEDGSTAASHRLASKESLITDIREGLRWIQDDEFARIAIISFSVGTLIFQALIIVFLGEAHSRQLSALAIGMVLAASGIGGALGSVVAARLLPRAGSSWMHTQTRIWFIGFALLILPAGRPIPSIAIIMAMLGLSGALGNIALDTHLMRNADQDILARVTSVSRFATFAACAVGPLMGGILVQEFGIQHALMCLFLFTPVLLLLSLRLHACNVRKPRSADHGTARSEYRGPRPGPRPGRLCLPAGEGPSERTGGSGRY
jgi:MFS family permease